MTTAPLAHPAAAGPMSWLRRAEAWLDARGRGAWIASMVAGFVVFWPIGLALVIYMSATGRFAGRGRATGRATFGRGFGPGFGMSRSTGNAAFDAYRDDTIHRLEEEQRAFEAFLQRLREAKDKAEFDQFMDDRRGRAGDDGDGSSGASPA